jgi:hypothetical protein
MSTRYRPIRRLAVAVPLAAALGACSRWARTPLPSPAGDRFYAGPVRVTRVDGPVLELDNVTVRRDSVVGRDYARTRFAISAAEVRTIEARRTDPLATAAVIAASLAAAVAVWGAIVISTVGLGN